jgi:glycosyltransferase involved in cell wall biosynthesis
VKILLLNYEFPPLGGGASPVSYEIAKGLASLGHKIDVVTMWYKNLPLVENIGNITIYRVKCLRSKKELCHSWELLSFIIFAKKFLKKHLKTNKYDINHTHFILPTGILSLWVKKKYGIPYVITVHGSDIPGYNPDRFKLLHKFTKPIIKKVYNSANLLISPSKYLKDLIISEINGSNIDFIPNGIYPDKFKPKKKKKIILSTGRLLARKGFQYLIEAVKYDKLDYEIHICGDGPMMNELKLISKNSKTKIVFHGWLDNSSKKYKDLLEKSSIYCLLSLRENASVAILEAMSAGCAVITSNFAGCPETIGKAGIIVNPTDISDVRNKIIELINNPLKMKRYQSDSRKRILDFFDWNKIIKKYEKTLKQQCE